MRTRAKGGAPQAGLAPASSDRDRSTLPGSGNSGPSGVGQDAEEPVYEDLLENGETLPLPKGIEDVPIPEDEAPAYTRHHMEAWLLVRNRQRNPVKRVLGIVEDESEGGAGTSRLIHPMSRFNLNLQVVSAIFVIYTGVVTPAVLAFEDTQDCGPLPNHFYADLVVEFFFVLEICIQMVTGSFGEKGEYIDHIPSVVVMYCRRPFLESFAFDLLTSMPFGWLELLIWLRQCDDSSGQLSGWALQVKTPVRILRPLRLLRLFRFVKVMRLWSVRGVAVPLRVQRLIGKSSRN
jgi:hypothetical protein